MLRVMSNKTRLCILRDDFLSLKSHSNAKETQEFEDLSTLMLLAESIIDEPNEYENSLDAILAQIKDILDQLKKTGVS